MSYRTNIENILLETKKRSECIKDVVSGTPGHIVVGETDRVLGPRLETGGRIWQPSSRTSRIRSWKYVSDTDYLYFYFVLRKNRSCNAPFCIRFDWDETGTYTDNNNIKNCELLVKFYPFTNASGTQPVCVKGFDPQATINGVADAFSVTAYDFDDGSDLSDSSDHYLEISIPRSKLNLPAVGTTINIAASLDYYETGFQSITLQ